MFSLKIGEEAGMNGFALTAAMVKSCAWPIAVIVIVWLLRDRLREILARLVELNYPGGSMKFAEGLAELKASSDEVIATEGDTTTAVAPAQMGDQLSFARGTDRYQLAARSPEAAILEGFQTVEIELLSFIGGNARSGPQRAGSGVVDRLVKREVISPDMLRYFNNLRRLRNQVAHPSGSRPSVEQARDYVKQCDIFILALREALKSFKEKNPNAEI